MADLPDRARVVVVGGGVGGTSVAFHLAELGERDVLLIERAELTSGSTFHSAGMVGQLRADPTLTRMNMYSVDLYRRLQSGDTPPGWVESGSLKLAASVERLEELRRQLSWAAVVGLPLEELTPKQAADRFPYLDIAGLHGAMYLPSDGHVDPSQLTYALAASARAAGVRIVGHTTVTGIDVSANRVRAVRTDRGPVECEVVVDCGGMFAAEIGRLAGIRIPVVPMSHQYLVTDDLPEGSPAGLPSVRDPDLLVYVRPEGRGLLMGGYERNPSPWSIDAHSFDALPADFNGRLLPEEWSRFEALAANAQRRFPILGDLGLKRMINGPEAFTPDNEFCLGETEIDGFFVAAGFNAHGIAGAGGIGRVVAEWIVDGSPSMDLWHMDVRRFGPHFASPGVTLARTVENYQTYYDIRFPGHQVQAARGLRTSPVYSWHAANDAEFGEKNGWERVEFYRSNAARGPSWRPNGWAARAVSPAVGAEHLATRTTVGLFDQSSFGKMSVSGPAAADLLERVCANRVARAVGAVTYTQMLNRRGGIEADVTVTRLAEDEFMVVTGTAFLPHDLALLRQRARALGLPARIADVSGQFSCFALWGPAARAVFDALSPEPFDPATFRFMSSHDVVLGDVEVRAQRVTFVGEFGWELYPPAESAGRLWAQLIDAGTDLGLVPAGYRAIESLRLEKGYRVWGTDITPETTPLEAGLGFAVHWDKPEGFVGREALVQQRDSVVRRQLCCLTLADSSEVVLGGEPVRQDGQVVGRVTSGGFGYSAAASLAYAYLPPAAWDPGNRVEVELFGRRIPATVVSEPVFDPAGRRMKGDYSEQ